MVLKSIIFEQAETNNVEENNERSRQKKKLWELLVFLGEQPSTMWMKKALSSITLMEVWPSNYLTQKNRH